VNLFLVCIDTLSEFTVRVCNNRRSTDAATVIRLQLRNQKQNYISDSFAVSLTNIS